MKILDFFFLSQKEKSFEDYISYFTLTNIISILIFLF